MNDLYIFRFVVFVSGIVSVHFPSTQREISLASFNRIHLAIGTRENCRNIIFFVYFRESMAKDSYLMRIWDYNRNL